MEWWFLLEELTPLILGSLAILTVGRIALTKARTRGVEGSGDPVSRDQFVSRDDLAVLRDRVQVLERAVTDPSRRLASEIDRLRD